MKKLFPIAFILIFVVLQGCKKETQDIQFAPISEYFPLESGKFIVYRLDSLVYTNFGSSQEIRSYDVKYTVDAEITDGLGRPAYRIIRSIRKNDSIPWATDATFSATNTGNTLEFVENNLRFVKLQQPIREGYTWKGNSYIDTYTPANNLRYLDDWDYTYEEVGMPLSIGTFNISDGLTVAQRDEVILDPTDPFSYSEINYGIEKYARGIGMVYKKFFHNEYQPQTDSRPGYYVDGSFGITLTMIDHN